MSGGKYPGGICSGENVRLPRFHCVTQQQVYRSRVCNIDKVKQRLLNPWHGMDHNAVNNATDE